MEREELSYLVFTSPIGEVLVAGTRLAVKVVSLGNNRVQLIADFLSEHPDARIFSGDGYLLTACDAIMNYIIGRTQTIDLAVSAEGTDLQRKVWQTLRTIPFGRTITYTELARLVGEPQAVRAVASACGANPVALVVPCHRVHRKGGDLGGYRWGIAKKQLLLDLERARTPAPAIAA